MQNLFYFWINHAIKKNQQTNKQKNKQKKTRSLVFVCGGRVFSSSFLGMPSHHPYTTVCVWRAVWGSPSVHPYTILSVVVPPQKILILLLLIVFAAIFPMDLSVIFSLYYYYYHYYYYLKETCISLSFQLSLFLLLLHHDRSLLLIYILYITLHHMAPFNLCDLCIFFLLLV